MIYQTIDWENDKIRSRDIPYRLWDYIRDLRSEHLSEGGDPRDFPNWLKEQGIEMSPLGELTVNDGILSFIELKYSK